MSQAAGIVKRSLVIAGHATSISLEEPFWRLLKMRAQREKLSIAAMVGRIDAGRARTNLSSAIRVHLLEWVLQNGEIRLDEAESAARTTKP